MHPTFFFLFPVVELNAYEWTWLKKSGCCIQILIKIRGDFEWFGVKVETQQNTIRRVNKKITKYFIVVVNALCEYFTNKNREIKFKYYVIAHEKTNCVFQTWLEVVESIQGVKVHIYKLELYLGMVNYIF